MSIDPTTDLEIPETGYYEYGSYVLTSWIRPFVSNAGFSVTSQVPANPRPPKLIVVKGAPTGGMTPEGGIGLVTSKRRLIIDCYHTSESLALRTAENVLGYIVGGMRTLGSGYRGVNVVATPYFFPDPDDTAKTPRAQFTVDIILRARFRAT